MTREAVRTLKKSIRASMRHPAPESALAISRESALALLARSIDFGHGRLAILRLALAVDTGASVPTQHWAYCARVAGATEDRKLREVYASAATRASEVTCAGPTQEAAAIPLHLIAIPKG